MGPPKAKKQAQAQPPRVSLGKPSLKARLESYYKLIAPDQISDNTEWRKRFDQIWDKYGGTENGEQKLASKLTKKYGTVVQFETAGTPNNQASSTTAEDVHLVKKNPETWYQLNNKERNSRCVDFVSDRFDPIAALTDAAATMVERINGSWLCRESPLLDRVEQCRAFLAITDPLYYRPPPAHRHNKTITAAAASSTDNRKKVPSCFASLASLHETGPLSLLYQAFIQRQRIRVVTRYVNSIRGTLTGMLLAFDKHMNLILQDVVENYCPRRCNNDDNDNLSNVESEVQRRVQGRKGKSSGPHWTNRQRKMHQIMVRGDNVVMVYMADAERSVTTGSNEGVVSSQYRNCPVSSRFGTPGSLLDDVAPAGQKDGRLMKHQPDRG